eukprot:TRINITY_DN1129_c1_g1_i1.p1 TRINITY_DN1129_c1_g1~~TRINITY_DN1129_c1_g1_i1.p1  ORF type:complete len:628 (+),score=93.14 TRINITY_DN1129_c1_g1_i1:42-1925(+)
MPWTDGIASVPVHHQNGTPNTTGAAGLSDSPRKEKQDPPQSKKPFLAKRPFDEKQPAPRLSVVLGRSEAPYPAALISQVLPMDAAYVSSQNLWNILPASREALPPGPSGQLAQRTVVQARQQAMQVRGASSQQVPPGQLQCNAVASGVYPPAGFASARAVSPPSTSRMVSGRFAPRAASPPGTARVSVQVATSATAAAAAPGRSYACPSYPSAAPAGRLSLEGSIRSSPGTAQSVSVAPSAFAAQSLPGTPWMSHRVVREPVVRQVSLGRARSPGAEMRAAQSPPGSPLLNHRSVQLNPTATPLVACSSPVPDRTFPSTPNNVHREVQIVAEPVSQFPCGTTSGSATIPLARPSPPPRRSTSMTPSRGSGLASLPLSVSIPVRQSSAASSCASGRAPPVTVAVREPITYRGAAHSGAMPAAPSSIEVPVVKAPMRSLPGTPSLPHRAVIGAPLQAQPSIWTASEAAAKIGTDAPKGDQMPATSSENAAVIVQVAPKPDAEVKGRQSPPTTVPEEQEGSEQSPDWVSLYCEADRERLEMREKLKKAEKERLQAERDKRDMEEKYLLATQQIQQIQQLRELESNRHSDSRETLQRGRGSSTRSARRAGSGRRDSDVTLSPARDGSARKT